MTNFESKQQAEAKHQAEAKQQAEKLAEKQAIDTLAAYMDAFRKFEKPLANALRKRYPADQIQEAEGKRCVVMVSGLKYYNLALYFQISQLSITQVQPFDHFHTFIQAPVGVIIEFFARMLSGDPDCLGDMMTRENVQIRGPHTYHDLVVWEDIIRILSSTILRFKSIL